MVGMERIGPGKTVLAYSEMMTIEQWLRILSKVSGVEVNYRQINLEDMERIAPGGLGREVGESGLFVEEFGWTGGEEGILDPKDVSVILLGDSIFLPALRLTMSVAWGGHDLDGVLYPE